MLKKCIFLILTFLVSSLTLHARIEVGAEQFDRYLPMLEGKKVAVVANHTSLVDAATHLVDALIAKGVDIKCIMSPEHGFRGNADAGATIKGGVDTKTGIKVVSLYGSNKQPSDLVMEGIDVLIYDLQDVGVRFFTYISTMHYCIEACAKNGKKMIILDRPNPNGSYVDGPVLESRHKSFVGIYPIPVVYGMSCGELAQMAIGEGWSSRCSLEVIECQNYSRSLLYRLPVKPSPNLKDMAAIYLYPSTCYFEATSVSLGRGTDSPFKMFGHPDMRNYSFSFTPRSVEGATNPPQLNMLCYGRDLRGISRSEVLKAGVDLSYIIEAYNSLGRPVSFFNSFFEKLIGVSYVREMIMSCETAEDIKARWSGDVAQFLIDRKQYLIYE